MKKLLILLFLSQQLFAGDIVITTDTTVNNTWTIPNTTILRFETGGKISGTGTISGGIIQANIYQHIFDSTITVNAYGIYNGVFSARWFGANPTKTDNSFQLQKSINTCMSRWALFIPKGTYYYKTGLLIEAIYQGIYVGCTIHLYGESSFWDSGEGTTLIYNNKQYESWSAIRLQLNKGTEIDHIRLVGEFVSPTAVDTIYYNIPFANYVDQSGGHSKYYYGITIDSQPNQNNSANGSTGLYIHDITVEKFATLIALSTSGTTLNADILIFERLHFGDARLGFQSAQGQEKGNVIRGIYSWGRIHTLFESGYDITLQNGGYTIDGGNIAGGCIRLFNITANGWNPVNISNIFAESIGTIGFITSSTSLQISNSTFDFAYPQYTKGTQPLAITSGAGVLFNSCLFRHFGQYFNMPFSGSASFMNCYWSGPYVNTTGSRIQVTLPSGIKLKL